MSFYFPPSAALLRVQQRGVRFRFAFSSCIAVESGAFICMVTAYRSKSIDQPGLIYVIHSIVHTSHARGSLLLLAIFMIHQRVDITFSEGISNIYDFGMMIMNFYFCKFLTPFSCSVFPSSVNHARLQRSSAAPQRHQDRGSLLLLQ